MVGGTKTPGWSVEKRERSDVEKPYDSFGRNGAK
jgi:hypothetical protein